MPKHNLLTIFIACSLFVTFSIPTTQAVTFLADKEVSSSEEILDDTYAAGGIVTIDSDVEGDLFVAGGSLTINGNINGDLVIAGGQITVNGDVSDDVRAGGGSVFINGNIGDDLITTGGQLNISAESLIGGSLIIGSGFANILGTINEDIRGDIGKMVFGGTVYGDINVKVQNTITLTKKAKINGNLIYSGLRKAELNEDQIEGFIEYNEVTTQQTNIGKTVESFFSKLHIIFKLAGYLSMLIIAFILSMLFPATLIPVANIQKKHPWRSMGLGLIITLCTIASIIILGITLIGLPLAGILLAVFLVTMYLAKIYVGFFIGRLLISPKKITKGKLFGVTALGMLLVEIIALVPFVGILIVGLATFIGFGALWTYKKSIYKKLNLQDI